MTGPIASSAISGTSYGCVAAMRPLRAPRAGRVVLNRARHSAPSSIRPFHLYTDETSAMLTHAARPAPTASRAARSAASRSGYVETTAAGPPDAPESTASGKIAALKSVPVGSWSSQRWQTMPSYTS